MLLHGQNLYRVTFKLNAGPKIKEVELTRLVVAYSEKEAAAAVGNNVITLVQPIEMDISLQIPNNYIRNGIAEGAHL